MYPTAGSFSRLHVRMCSRIVSPGADPKSHDLSVRMCSRVVRPGTDPKLHDLLVRVHDWDYLWPLLLP